jgi:hypothetical protein
VLRFFRRDAARRVGEKRVRIIVTGYYAVSIGHRGATRTICQDVAGAGDAGTAEVNPIDPDTGGISDSQ